MCKRSCCCCTSKSHEGAGIAAVAAIAAGAIVAAKIGPIVARILHLAVEVLTIILLTAASALTAILLTWVTVRIVRWRVRQHHPRQPLTLRPVPTAAGVKPADSQPGCLACGDTGTVLRAITGSRYQPRPCPVCEPTRKTE
jgi:hypothetical protein